MGETCVWLRVNADNGHDIRLEGTHLDREIIDTIKASRAHPGLEEELPRSVKAYQPEEASEAFVGAEVVVSGVTHRTVGAAAGVALGAALGLTPWETLVLLAGGYLGALLPDYDTPQSTAAHCSLKAAPLVGLVVYFLPYGSLGLAVGAGALLAFTPLLLRTFIGHRGPLHSLALWTAATIVAFAAVPWPLSD